MQFTNKTAMVTGAASGIGRSVAAALCRAGAKRIIMLDQDADSLHAAAKEIGDTAIACLCDVSNPQSVEQIFNSTTISEGFDILITAAGILGPYGSIADCTPEDWEKIFSVNVRGTFLCVYYGINHIRKRGGGSIVTFGSVAGLAGSATRGAYSATKGAIVMMTRSLALAHAKENIRANCVCPGPILTPMADASWSHGGSLESFEALKSAALMRTPSGRFGTAEEVAEIVLFLASDAAAHITGVALPVDGGRLA